MIETFLITGACIAWFKVLVQPGELLHKYWKPFKAFWYRELMGLLGVSKPYCEAPQWARKLFDCTRCVMFWWSLIIWIPIGLYFGVFPLYHPFVTAAIAKFFYNQITV